MKFIQITPVWYNSVSTKYETTSSSVTIAVDSISMVYHPDIKYKQEYYTIWFKGMGQLDTIKTFDPVVDMLLDKR
jgi:hypothetical protein